MIYLSFVIYLNLNNSSFPVDGPGLGHYAWVSLDWGLSFDKEFNSKAYAESSSKVRWDGPRLDMVFNEYIKRN